MRVPTGRLRIVSTPQGEAAEAHEGPPSPGRYIREQRMRRGMSVEQLAIDTKIPRSSIDALEEDRFTALPGPVFVKGFFRCCARSLSLDAEVVMALLHEHERAAQQLKSGRRERQRPELLGRAASTAAPTMPRSPLPAAPVHAVAGEAVAHPPPALFDLRGLAPLLARFTAMFGGLRVGFAANSRLLMWVAVSLMVALIVLTAFVIAGGNGPSLPQS